MACVLHTGYLDRQGYGNSGGALAHRTAWIAVHGPVPPGLELHHLCENKACINVAHLLPVTRLQHEALHAPTHCVNGHPFDAANTYNRLPSAGGRRGCRACNRAAVARYKKRKTGDVQRDEAAAA